MRANKDMPALGRASRVRAGICAALRAAAGRCGRMRTGFGMAHKRGVLTCALTCSPATGYYFFGRDLCRLTPPPIVPDFQSVVLSQISYN